MGILIDIILIAIIVISAFLGYKKGLVKLGAGLFAGIIAIIITIILYKPVSEMIIKYTPIDEKISNAIIQNTSNLVENNAKISEKTSEQIQKEMIPGEANLIAMNIVSMLTSLILFIVVKIILSIIISLMDSIANLPLLKQFNEVGGTLYGLIRGAIISLIIVLIIGAIIRINPENILNEKVQESHITKIICEKLVKI